MRSMVEGGSQPGLRAWRAPSTTRFASGPPSRSREELASPVGSGNEPEKRGPDMQISRRDWLGMAAAAAALPAAVRAQAVPSALAIRSGDGARYAAAIEAIRAYAAAELAATGLPGMTMALADDQGFAATLSLGWADIDRRVPVTPTQLFEIGSISKSLTGLWLNRAADQGRIDLHAPVSRYLPDVPLPPEPITVADLLDHAGGLTEDAPVFPRVPGGRLWCGFTPGSRMSYSNTGYTLLGMVTDRIAGRPHPQALADDIIAPLGMAGATAHILTEDRPRFATGYAPLRDDRPALTRVPLAPGPWTEEDMAAGAVAAPAEAMIGYLRTVMALHAGRGGVLMSDKAAQAMLAADIAAPIFGPGARYASGFAKVAIDDRPALHHTGGMLTFSSSYHADGAAGVACFASVNARLDDYRPRKATAYAVQVLRAVRAGTRLPPMPDPLAFRRIAKPGDYAGRYVAADGRVLEVRAAATGLELVAGGARGRLEPAGTDSLGTDHPAWAVHLLQFEREHDRVVRLWWGGLLFGRDQALPQPAGAPGLLPLEGRYVAHDPWSGTADVFARGDTLVLEGAGPITLRPGGYWSPREDTGGIDRYWFEAPVGGRPSRLVFSGLDLTRIS